VADEDFKTGASQWHKQTLEKLKEEEEKEEEEPE
jgi:hypothetical protein